MVKLKKIAKGSLKMNIIHKTYSKENGNAFLSHSSLSYIFAQCWRPEKDEDVKAIFQITHGMAEHSDRYEKFGRYLAELGYAVFIHEHIGHGRSVKSEEFLGYFGDDKDSWKHRVEDCHTMTLVAKEECPDVPVILFGHSMGSFVARAYLAKYSSEIKAAVICGTSGPNPAAKMGISLAAAAGRMNGYNQKSDFLNNIAFGTYNKKFIKEGEEDLGFNWLSVNRENIDRYNEDPLCGYVFTASGFKGLFGILSYVSSNEWYSLVPSDIPILLTSGKDYPVGNFSKGVRTVYDKLIKTGHSKVDLKLWPGLRHEILNEEKQEVFDYISNWADKKI